PIKTAIAAIQVKTVLVQVASRFMLRTTADNIQVQVAVAIRIKEYATHVFTQRFCITYAPCISENTINISQVQRSCLARSAAKEYVIVSIAIHITDAEHSA